MCVHACVGEVTRKNLEYAVGGGALKEGFCVCMCTCVCMSAYVYVPAHAPRETGQWEVEREKERGRGREGLNVIMSENVISSNGRSKPMWKGKKEKERCGAGGAYGGIIFPWE